MQECAKESLSKESLIKGIIIYILGVIILTYVFYDNLWFGFFMLPFFPIYLKLIKKQEEAERSWKLRQQFGDAIVCISAALESGYSIENSINEAYRDLSQNYSESERIMLELKRIMGELSHNISVETAMLQFGERSKIPDIISFADVFATSKRTGGDLISVIRYTSGVIRARIDLDREIKTEIAAKKYESDIMRYIPIGILLYLKLFNAELLSAVYGNFKGILFMSIILLAYLGLVMFSKKIIDSVR